MRGSPKSTDERPLRGQESDTGLSWCQPDNMPQTRGLNHRNYFSHRFGASGSRRRSHPGWCLARPLFLTLNGRRPAATSCALAAAVREERALVSAPYEDVGPVGGGPASVTSINLRDLN